MFSEMKRTFERQFELVSARPLGCFRILFSFCLLLEAIQILFHWRLFFVGDLFSSQILNLNQTLLVIWCVFILGLMCGLFTRWSALGTYFGVIYFLIWNPVVTYHADLIYHATAFVILFLPIGKSLSIDRLRQTKCDTKCDEEEKVPRLVNNLVLLFGAGFMYFDSAVYKIESSFWLDGLGFWLPASFPSFSYFDWNALLNQKLLVQFAGYLTLFYEILFIFLIWFAQARMVLFVIGVLLHLGIAIVLPIPLFGLVMVAILICFLPDRNIESLFGFSKIKIELTNLKFCHSAERLKMIWLTFGILLLFLYQLILAFHFEHLIPLFVREPVQLITGVTFHRVFGESQFKSMYRDVGIVAETTSGRQWIPYTREDGHAGFACGGGRFWSSWWAYAANENLNSSPAWIRAAEAWSIEKNLPLETLKFELMEKKVIRDQSFEYDRILKQKSIPWKKFGEITYRNGQRRVRFLSQPKP